MVSQASGVKTWVSKSGQIRSETESQRRLLSTEEFQLSLSFYINAYNRFLFTAESQREVLNQRMQRAYEQDMTDTLSNKSSPSE